MTTDARLMDMLTGYSASHQHPFNIAVHMIGIPTTMLGVLTILSWVRIEIVDFSFSLAHAVVLGFFLFYLTLDVLSAVVFVVFGFGLTLIAGRIAELSVANAAGIAGIAVLGGYALQFVGHAVEKSMPVLVKHPLQANLAAPFFIVVELFKLLGIREKLFNEVQRRVALRRRGSRGN